MEFYPDISQDFWLTLTQITLTPNSLACHAHTFTKAARTTEKVEFDYTYATLCFERTQQTLILTKAVSWDKIKSSLNKPTIS